MNKGLKSLKELRENVCYFAIGDYANPRLDIIEKELTDYAEIKEIAKHYHWEDLAHDVFKIETDRKWQLKFESAICDVQEDYRKARALEIIKKKKVDVDYLDECIRTEVYPLSTYNFSRQKLTQEEYDLLKEVL